MAKLFYSLDEAGDRLGMSADEVRGLIDSGQLQEFRDGDRVMLKVDQVDLLAGDDSSEDTGGIPLAQDQDEDMISLASDSGSAFAIDAPQESGISIFDEADELETADPSAQTQISDTGATDFGLDPSSSGSGLLDLTREVDDTSLGADLMDDVYSGGDTIGETVGGAEAMSPVEGGELFETTTAQTETGAGAPGGVAMVAAERIDSGFSGFTFGAFLAVAIGMLLSFAVVVGTLTGGLQDLIGPVADNMAAVVGGLFGGFVVLGGVCGFVMKGK